MRGFFPPLRRSSLKRTFVAFISNCPDSRVFCYCYSGYVPYFLYSERVAKHLILIKLIIFTFKIKCLIKIF